MTSGGPPLLPPDLLSGARPAVAVLGTMMSLDIRGDRPGVARVLAAASALLAGIDKDFSPLDKGSWISRLQRRDVEESELPDRVRDVLALYDGASQQTGGWYGARLRDSDADPIGLVRGWAADRVSDLFTAQGFPDHCVRIAGDIVLSGSPAPDLRWRVAVTDPRVPDRRIGFTDGTSSRGGRSFGGTGRRWAVATFSTAEPGSRAVAPSTGRVATVLLSASIIGVSGAETDAQAAALVASGGSGALTKQLLELGSAMVTVDSDGHVADPLGYLHPVPFS